MYDKKNHTLIKITILFLCNSSRTEWYNFIHIHKHGSKLKYLQKRMQLKILS